jgi:hypothetical protein
LWDKGLRQPAKSSNSSSLNRRLDADRCKHPLPNDLESSNETRGVGRSSLISLLRGRLQVYLSEALLFPKLNGFPVGRRSPVSYDIDAVCNPQSLSDFLLNDPGRTPRSLLIVRIRARASPTATGANPRDGSCIRIIRGESASDIANAAMCFPTPERVAACCFRRARKAGSIGVFVLVSFCAPAHFAFQ